VFLLVFVLRVAATGPASAVARVVGFDDFDRFVAITAQEIEDPSMGHIGQCHDGESEQGSGDQSPW
jgi:hypothetical protein